MSSSPVFNVFGGRVLTRYSKHILLSVLIIVIAGSAFCRRSSAVVIVRDFNLPIPSPDDDDFGRGRMDEAIIDINESFLIADLDVAVLLTHGAFVDLEIVLEGPDETSITLNPAPNYAFIIRGEDGRSRSAGGQNRFFFDDEAAVDIEHAAPPFDQPFRPPAGSELSAFDGRDVSGRWRLKIRDVSMDYTGRLEGVELIVSTPEPGSICMFALAGAAVRLSSRRRRR